MGIMESIHCLSTFGKINNEHITIVCSEEKIYEIKKEFAGMNFDNSENLSHGEFNPNKGLKVLWCEVTYVFITDLKFG